MAPERRPDVILETWARCLNNERLAADLERVAHRVTSMGPDQRAALLREAARRMRMVDRHDWRGLDSVTTPGGGL